MIKYAELELKEAIEKWNAKAAEEDGKNEDPYPTLLSVGLDLHRQDVGDEAHNKAMIDVEQKLRAPRKAVQAMEGTLGSDIKPALRAANSWLTTYTNFRILSMSLFTSFQDVNGIIINGGTLGEAWETFVAGIKGVRESWKKNGGTPDDMMREAEFWGTVDAGSVMDVIGETYGSVYMTGAAKKLSDGFFRAIGMEGWNRGIRAKATQVAVRCIVDMARNPEAYTSDPAKKAQFERLFGQGADPKDIRLTADGKLDRSSAANVAAVTRWVLDAVPAPNAAVRTIWMSDPRFQTFAHLKNYTYTWHRTIMRSAIEQARLGNYRPATVAALGYIPIAIAAGALKEMLIPGDEPAWMKSGMAGAMSYGVQRAGVLGVPQMYLGDALEGDLARVLGPFWDEMQNIATIPLGETETKLPLGAKIGWKDHTLGHEFANALPFGNLAVRVADAW